MAITDRNTLKNWFKRLDKPTQEQFWAWMDSFWHKGEKIPQSSIENWGEFLSDLPNEGELENYVLKDGNNIDEESRTALREKLEISDTPNNLGLVDTEDETGNVYTKEQINKKLKINDSDIGGLIKKSFDSPYSDNKLFTYITDHRRNNPEFYGSFDFGGAEKSEGVFSVDLSINDEPYQGRFHNNLYKGDVEALRNLGTPGYYCFSAGAHTTAGGSVSVALGYGTIAFGEYCYAEGNMSVSIGQASHAEGTTSVAEGHSSHAEGVSTYAKGGGSHAQGRETLAEGECSHAEGAYTSAKSYVENARGLYNYSPKAHGVDRWDDRDLIESVGGGTSEDDRYNLFERYKNGAFKWISKELDTIHNPVIGLHVVDVNNNLLNVYTSVGWSPYLTAKPDSLLDLLESFTTEQKERFKSIFNQ